MGTIISLTVGGMDIASSKNSRGTDHGSLFQETDRGRSSSDQIDYDYFGDEDDPTIAAMEQGFSKQLSAVVQRLELLGYSLDTVRSEYEKISVETAESNKEVLAEEIEAPTEFLSFDDFLAFVLSHNVGELDDTYIDGFDEAAQQTIEGRFHGTGITAKLPRDMIDDPSSWSEKSFFNGLLSFLHPYSIARILGENPANASEPVTWQYGPLVESGWAKVSEFTANCRRRETFLIATEGSSDTAILKHAIALLRPEVVDFFRFIDMDERHPFPGTGNLLRFAEGLAKMDVHNQTVFLYDNDAEGRIAYDKTRQLGLPANMRAAILPDQESFRLFRTLGPSGAATEDINGRAAAIECYLDLERSGLPTPVVRWSSYKEEISSYQGALEQKSRYAKDFLKVARSGSPRNYDMRKIEDVVDTLISQSCDISSTARIAQFADW